MPYVRKVCSVCDHDAGERYQNVRKCPVCREVALVSVSSYAHQSRAIGCQENRLLRQEVNSLRSELGRPLKYQEYGYETRRS